MRKFRKVITWLMPAILVVMLAGLILSRVYQPDPDIEPDLRIHYEEAAGHVGKYAVVCGRVAEASLAEHVGGEPIFLNFGRPHPDQEFSVVIWGRDRNRWPVNPVDLYHDRRICVTGRIELHRETPQIVVENPDRIAVTD